MWSSVANKAIIAFGTAIMTATHVTAVNGDCQGQGQGNCQLQLTATAEYDWVYWQHATIYDYKCDVIGGKDVITTGTVIYSQLPYVVIIDSVVNVLGDISVIKFRYADYTWTGQFLCSAGKDSMHRDTYRCIHAFPCNQK
ncbi:hypothetical protein B0H65DRAFT_560624 [Neurospora tetraspora]|uniref:Uncharacterized protein n=1 Tax=Neurospora tetraspora TaxID=94610 RepID=A0AAE0JA13_9PEZI|nr:hypothetical protein B0H65DRAFT_560624 [Neurospora tetraspora]